VNRRQLGSYYTPNRLAKVIADYCLEKFQEENISILEPSVGDGNFAEAISQSNQLNRFKSVNLTIVEKEKNELLKAVSRCHDRLNLNSFHSDYLDYHNSSNDLFSLIIGNPPYVKSSLLSNNQKKYQRIYTLQVDYLIRKLIIFGQPF
jgi:adenine-specific DNA-methyltransferase